MAVRMSDHITGTAGALRFEPSAKRVRCSVDGTTLADTTAAVLVWEPGRVVPAYAVPMAEFRAELVALGPEAPEPGDQAQSKGPASFAMHTCDGRPYTVRVQGRELVAAAFRPDDPDLADYLLLDFLAFTWTEESEPVFGHPHDPFKRIDILETDRHVVVVLDGLILADSTRAVALFETQLPTRWYLPPSDVRMDLLTPSESRTTCAYKGHASYYSAAGAGSAGRDLAWTYPDPLAEAGKIGGRICFFNERVDLTLDGIPAERPVTVWSASGG